MSIVDQVQASDEHSHNPEKTSETGLSSVPTAELITRIQRIRRLNSLFAKSRGILPNMHSVPGPPIGENLDNPDEALFKLLATRLKCTKRHKVMLGLSELENPAGVVFRMYLSLCEFRGTDWHKITCRHDRLGRKLLFKVRNSSLTVSSFPLGQDLKRLQIPTLMFVTRS